MLDIVTFMWKPAEGYRSKYRPGHVNTLRSMIARNYPHPHRVNVVTDTPSRLIDPRVRVVPLWDTFKELKSPHGGNNPACYRRLLLWGAEAAETFGPRILSIDLDMVLTGDVSSLWNRPEPCVMWADNLNPTTPYNGAMQLITPGAFPDVLDKFDPTTSPARARSKGYFGSDQAWLCYALGPGQARWRKEDGAVSWRVHCRQTRYGLAHLPFDPQRDCAPDLPSGAKVVNFHGVDDPWTVAPVVPWVAEHYR